MRQTTDSRFGSQDIDVWTPDDAEAWNEAQLSSSSETALDEDPLLDNDLWMNADVGGDTVAISGLGRLQLRL